VIEDLTECYRILELAPGATQEEVKRSYRELVKVWHPDRFSGDPKLQRKAQEKLKQINLAYEWICKGEAGGPRRKTRHTGTNESQAGEQSRPSGSSSSTNNRDEPRAEAPRQPQPPPSQSTPAPTTNWGRRIVQFAVTVVIIAVIKAVFSTGHRPSRQTTDYAPPYNQPSQGYRAPETTAVQPMPKARQHLTLDQIVDLHGEALKRRPDLGMSVQEFSRYMQANQSDYDFSEGIAYSPPPNTQPEPMPSQVALGSVVVQPPPPEKSESSTADTVAPAKPRAEGTNEVVVVALAKTRDSVSPTPSNPTRDFFTVGSTKDEVLAVQGTPSSFSQQMFWYGSSSVQFQNGRVASWSDNYPKLKAKLLPAPEVEAKEFFTVGSTKDEVLAVQGTPSSFSGQMYWYGSSSVQFSKDKVVSWSDNYPKLKARLLPSVQSQVRDYFTVGSSKDDVLAIQGTPSNFSDQMFWYGSSSVQFRNGKVVSWSDNYPKLKAKLLPTSPVEAKSFFTVGSTKDEVLAVQGTPSNFSEQMYWYGSSSVQFRNDKVVSWSDNYPKLKARLTTGLQP
jgi:outer membrane protein assembly factor BamE (lipoprotein component of BamABCDE complex)